MHAQQTGVTVPDVRLEPHDGKTVFYLGEPVQLDLVFENHTGTAVSLNTTIYGDLSDKVEITPATGWFQWQTQSGHDYTTAFKLEATPIRIPVRLDEGFVFREQGQYHVRVTTARAEGGTGDARLAAVTTNEVDLEMKTMPPEVEGDILRRIRADLASAGQSHSGREVDADAMARLATLQGERALAEKIELLKQGDDDFRSVYREAFASTHNLQRQLELLEDAWTNPSLVPRYDTPDALTETRMLLAGRNLEGWHMMLAPSVPDAVGKQISEAHHADMAALLDSMPRRTGEGRIMGAYFLIEFGGLTEAEHARAIEYALEEFPQMDSTSQHMVLETARPPLHDPRLVPMLKSLLAKDPSDKDAIGSLVAIDSGAATPWVISSICSPAGNLLLNAFKDVAADRLAQVDGCLGADLRVVPETVREDFQWKLRATLAARFATPAILPALKAGWQKPAQDGPAMAILLRDAPVEAVALLSKKAASGDFDAQIFFESSDVFRQIHQPFPEAVVQWLRDRLAGDNDQQAGVAAYALSVGGDGSDSARIVERLQRLRRQWSGREREVATSQLGAASQARKCEIELASALASYESQAKTDPERRHDLGQGCMSDECHWYLK